MRPGGNDRSLARSFVRFPLLAFHPTRQIEDGEADGGGAGAGVGEEEQEEEDENEEG